MTEKYFLNIIDKHRNNEIWRQNNKKEWELINPLS